MPVTCSIPKTWTPNPKPQRSGRRSLLTNAQPNYLYELEETAATAPAPAQPALPPSALFERAAGMVPACHETPVNDFQRQSLVSRQLSHLGAGVAWCDLHGDGWEELPVSSGRGGRLQVLGNRQGQLRPMNLGAANALAEDDQAIVLARPTTQACWVWVSETNYETG